MAQDFYFRLLKLRKEQNYHLSTRLYSYKDLTKDVLAKRPEEFLNFTDDYFFSLIREVLDNKKLMNDYDPTVVKYAELITHVQPLVPVTYFETFADGITENNCLFEYLLKNNEIIDELCDRHGIDRDSFILNKPFKVTLYKSNSDQIKVFRDKKIITEDISESNASILKFLVSKEYRIYRIYTFSRDEATKIRNALLDFIKDKNFIHTGDLKVI
jgi:hypothetical protein